MKGRRLDSASRKPSSVAPPNDTEFRMRTLWRAVLNIGTNRDEFLFREENDFQMAAQTAAKLLEASLSARMVGAEITAVERVAHLWN